MHKNKPLSYGPLLSCFFNFITLLNSDLVLLGSIIGLNTLNVNLSPYREVYIVQAATAQTTTKFLASIPIKILSSTPITCVTGGGYINNVTYSWMSVRISLFSVSGGTAYYAKNVEDSQAIEVWAN